MTETSLEVGGNQPAGEASPIGLSHVHISSAEVNCEQLQGVFADTSEGRFPNGSPILAIQHPTGCSAHYVDDHVCSARRWRDGISIGVLPVIDPSKRSARGEVRQFSKGSRARMVRYLRECEADYKFMGTLTVGGQYSRDPEDFRKAVDRWLVAAMRELKQAHRRAGESEDEASIFWWVEFQSRGAPHLHLYYTKFIPWKALADRWSSICLRFNLCSDTEADYFWKTSTKFEKIRCGYRGMISYARKYAIKQDQKEEVLGVLDGGWRGRFWGVRGNRKRGSCHVKILSKHSSARTFSALQKWLDRCVSEGKLGKYTWEYGEGAIYYVKGGRQWTDTDMGPTLELYLSKICLGVPRQCR